jgi:SAM-dependent methyltransferase
MAVNHALLQTQHAFDGVAAAYDRSNADNAILRAMRTRVWQVLERHAPRGADILDLGCGPGCDAEYLALRGHRVTAIDWSPAMVEEAGRRVRAAGVADRVDIQHLGIHEIDRLERADAPFDAAYSNFGPLNCVADLRAVAQPIAGRLKPGGVLVASVIGRVCPWEIALYAARGDLSRAAIRFRRGLVPVPPPRVRADVRRRRHGARLAPGVGPSRSAAISPGICRPPSRARQGAAARRGSVRRMAGASHVG